MKYKEEQISLLNLILFGGLTAFFFFFLYLFFSHKINFANYIIYLFLAVYILWSLIFYFEFFLPSWQKRQKYQRIRKNGLKVKGFIEDFAYKVMVVNFKKGRKEKNFYLIVSYIDSLTREKKIIQTPPINFNPLQKLKSRVCSVYIYQDEVYVTDFEKRNKNDKILWTNDMPAVIKYHELKRVYKNDIFLIIRHALFYLLVFLIFVMVIYLFSKKS